MIKCDRCKTKFEVGNRPDGLPNGIGLQMEDGKVINVCCDCVMLLGRLNKRGREKFLEDLK